MGKISKTREAAPPSFSAGELGHFRLLREFREALADAQAEVEPHQREMLVRGSAYIADRLYGMEHAFFGELEKKAILTQQLDREQRQREAKTREAFWKRH